MMRCLGWPSLLLLPWLLAGEPPDEPVRTEFEERVEVREVQIPVTVWPRDGDAEACDGLTEDDFLLEVRDVETPIRALLRGEAVFVEGQVGEPEGDVAPPLQLVVLIDEFHHSCPACAARRRACDGASAGKLVEAPFGRPVAYAASRRMLREAFREGDRVLLATISLWPMVRTPWLTSREEALAELDRLEGEDLWVRWQFGENHCGNWYEGMLGFVRALGGQPGIKDVLFPTCHFPLGDASWEEIAELGAVAAANDVVLHTVDLEFCPSAASGGEAIGPLAANLGGFRFRRSQGVAGAVSEIRRIAGCRFLLSFEPGERRDHRIGTRIRVSVLRPGFDVRAPASFHGPEREETPREVRQALFQLAAFGKKLEIRASVVPRHAFDHGERWRAQAFVRIRPLEPVPEDARPEKLILDLMTWQKGDDAPFAAQLEIAGDELRRMLGDSAGTMFTLPFEARAGKTYLSAIVHDGEGDPRYAAARRHRLDWPDAREARTRGFLMPASRVAAADAPNRVHALPILGRRVEPGGDLVFLSYACDPAGDAVPAGSERLFRRDGRAVVLMPSGPAGRVPDSARGRCSWVVLIPEQPLGPGEWSLRRGEPPVVTVGPAGGSGAAIRAR